jgi:hypothetical protein
MFPLAFLDLSAVPPSEYIHPLWKNNDESQMHMKVYLSSQPKFQMDFLRSEFPTPPSDDQNAEPVQVANKDVEFIWDKRLTSASLSKNFLLTTLDCNNDPKRCEHDPSYKYANRWLDQSEKSMLEIAEGGILGAISASAGEGIESTSFLLTLYQSVSSQLSKLFRSKTLDGGLSVKSPESEERVTINLHADSPLWHALQTNSTIYVHVALLLHRSSQTSGRWSPKSFEQAATALQQASRSNSLLLGQVNLIKYDLPHHISKPKRLLYRDIIYLFQRFVLSDDAIVAPWDIAKSKPTEYAIYERSLAMKKDGKGYPYWKPEVSIKYVNDDVSYPAHLAHRSGLELVATGGQSKEHPTGLAYMPALHVDEIGMTSEKYIPINETVTSLPLHISFDRSDVKPAEHTVKKATATAGGISPARWRLLTHLSSSIESQKQLGFEQSDIDDLRRLIADTNVTLLAITMLASALHLLFEFLTFKSEVSFWNQNKDLTGLSVRSLFLDMIGQVIILLFLIEKDSSLLMTVPSGIGCLIALWKCQRAAGLKFVTVKSLPKNRPVMWWNIIPRLVGYELFASRLEIKQQEIVGKGGKTATAKPIDLTALTIECDRQATRILGTVLLPFVMIYIVYAFIREEHVGWYSWLITSASSAVYALGFVLMTPQLFLNYKLKSVAHLPWRVLAYKFLNTFIDDLFSFIIRMPTMARISCFRDDVVFFIYLYQRWLYPVDKSRPVEGGGESEDDQQASEKKNQ